MTKEEEDAVIERRVRKIANQGVVSTLDKGDNRMINFHDGKRSKFVKVGIVLYILGVKYSPEGNR